MKRVTKVFNLPVFIAGMLAAMGIMKTGIAIAQVSHPTIYAEFKIAAPSFENLKSRNEVEAYISQHLSDKCDDHFSFIRWKVLKSTPASTEVLYRLTLKLVEEERELGPEISLKFEAELFKKKHPLKDIPLMKIYESWDDHPTHDPERLRRDVVEQIDNRFVLDHLRDSLHKNFLKNVPLAQKIYVDNRGHLVIVPLLWHELQASKNSRLHVDFSALTAGVPQPGGLELRPIGPEGKTEWQNMVQCIVLQFFYYGIEFAEWHDEIPNVLVPERLRRLYVYMEYYDKNYETNTMGGLVTDFQ